MRERRKWSQVDGFSVWVCLHLKVEGMGRRRRIILDWTGVAMADSNLQNAAIKIYLQQISKLEGIVSSLLGGLESWKINLENR